mmetsp:Transcript_23796/g.52027  ORF Transcript_23796/g.52027 Transcript_23796/m.52027 type:complete len:293 (+) Transcript_23796:96-974(+)
MHCFEPMPQTVRKLEASAKQLGYDKLGFRVVPKAVSNKPGTIEFLTKTKAGVENIGINNKCRGDECQAVEVVPLGGYVKNVIDKEHDNDNDNNNNTPPRIIHHLSIDVEGYDADVLLGAGPDVLKRVEYLEFEYNWMGSWAHQHLHDVITMLDGKDHRPIFHDDQDSNSNINSNNGDGDKTANNYGDLSFTCYWAGKQKLWRITDCWLHAYDLHTWGNVACVNRKLAPMLADKMEAVFQNTLLLDETNDGFDTLDPGRSDNWSNDPMLRIDPHESFVSTEYLAKWNDRSKQK